MEGNDEELEVSRLLDIIRKEQQRQSDESNRSQFSDDVQLQLPTVSNASFEPMNSDASLTTLRSNLIPVLYNLSTQILQILGRGHYQHTLETVTQPTSPDGQAFTLLLDLFLQTKHIFTSNKFIGSSVHDPMSTRLAIQRADLATFALAVFGSIEVGFYSLNEQFLNTFIVPDGKFLKSQATLYLELKTQAYISAMNQLSKPKYEILDQLFPSDIFSRSSKTPTETEFEQKCHRRRYILDKNDNIDELKQNYSWMSFVKELHDYLSKQILIHEDIQVPSNTGSRASNNENTKTKSRTGTRPRRRPSTTTTSVGATSIYEAVKDHQNRLGSSSAYARRPWTKEEETALLKGLDKVQGPYWSQILKLHGPGGTESETLKDRSQVQLKDKARNLKMFFIKCGLPLPTVFEYVTGDVRTRNKSSQRNRTIPITSPNVAADVGRNEITKDTATLEKLIESVGEYINREGQDNQSREYE